MLPSRDWSTLAEAHVLAETIRRYWEAKGRTVNMRVVIDGADHSKKPLYVIRSDMVRGMPKA
jgi:hypothetical protein